MFGPEGGAPGGSADDVVANWDRIKQVEKGRQSVLDGIPAALPALAAARKVARRSAGLGVGPDAPADGPADAGALGEALFGLVEWARRHDLDAEDALRATVAEFSAGVRAAEAAAIADGVDLATADEDTRRTYHTRSRAARDF